jgi:hypothetical protein
MKFYNTFNRGGGRYTTQEWSAEEMFNFDLLSLCFILAIGCILSFLASAISLIVRLWGWEHDEKLTSVWGIAFATYFIFDYCKGWFVTSVLRMFEDKPTMESMLAFNISLLITHVVLLIFGDTVYFNSKEESRKITLTIVTAVFLGITYLITKSFI